PRRSRQSGVAARDTAGAGAGDVQGPLARAVDRRRRDRGRVHVQDRMNALLLTALWTHLAASALLVGALAMLLLAGMPTTLTACRWDDTIVRWARRLLLLALGSGFVWLMVRTAVLENRPHAALEPPAIWHVVLDTWPGLVWLARHALLLVLAAFLAMRADVTHRLNWLGARGEALLLAASALALVSASSHAAAITAGAAQAVVADVAHLLGTGL